MSSTQTETMGGEQGKGESERGKRKKERIQKFCLPHEQPMACRLVYKTLGRKGLVEANEMISF
jgi:hypothetical protein